MCVFCWLFDMPVGYDFIPVAPSNNKRSFDVLIVGAGPAGNLAAHRLTAAGHSVAVLDWRGNIGDKLCTGIIGRECKEAYPPAADHILRETDSATVVAPSGRAFALRKNSPQAYVIDRVAYVASFAERAQAAGAEYVLGPRVGGIEVGPHGVTVTTSLGDQTQTQKWSARALVLASGFGSPLVRMAGIDVPPGGAFMTGSQAEATIDGLDETRVYLGSKVAPGSFGWVVPINDSRALVGLVTRQKLNGHMSDFVSALRAEGTIGDVVESPQRWGIPVRPLARTYGERVVVVGDAAGLAKPTTGGGIYYALLSGELAARTLDKALTEDDLSARRLKAYERAWKNLLGKELKIGYFARLLYEALGDKQIEFLLGQVMSDEVRPELLDSDEVSFDWHSGFIKRALAHRSVGRTLRALGPASLQSVAGGIRSLAG
jgi:digeranylgeranylglycerophospholipid reductase